MDEKITVFNAHIVMCEEKEIENDNMDKVIEDLGGILNTCKVPHAFCLPSTDEVKEEPSAVAILNFKTENYIAVGLINALYGKLYRGFDDERIARYLTKVAGYYIEKEKNPVEKNLGRHSRLVD